MLTTTTKIIAYLALISTMGYETPAENADSNDDKNLSALHATSSEMQISPADSTAFKKSEERMARLPRAPRALHLPAALYAGQANVAGDLLRASTSNAVAETSLTKTLSAEAMRKGKSISRSEVMEKLRRGIQDNGSTSTAKGSLNRREQPQPEEPLKRRKQVEADTTGILKQYVHHERDVELMKKLMEWLKRREDPHVVSLQLQEPYRNSPFYKFDIGYKQAYNYREDSMRSMQAKWYSKGTRPEDARTKLEKVFPGQEQLADIYHEDYKTLYKGYSGNLARLKPWLHPGKATKADLETFVQMQGKASDWWRESKEPSKVFQLLGSPYSTNPLYNVYQDYQDTYEASKLHVHSRYDKWLAEGYRSFDVQKTLLDENMGGLMAEQYSKEYQRLTSVNPTHIEKLKTWLKEGLKPQDVETRLKLQSEMKASLSNDEINLLKLVYSSWYTRDYTLNGWKLTRKTPEDIRVSLNLDLSSSSDDNVKLYYEFVDWFVDTHPEEVVEISKQHKMTPGEVLTFMKLDSLKERQLTPADEVSIALLKDDLLQKPDFSLADEISIILLSKLKPKSDSYSSVSKKIICYNEYANWWLETQLETYTTMWMEHQTNPKEVAFTLGQDTPHKSKLSIEKMKRVYEQYLELWNAPRP